MKFILARKVNMTQVYTSNGKVVPVTVLDVPGSCKVVAIKTREKDGYEAVQVELGKKKREFRSLGGSYEVGQEIKLVDFEPGEIINITGLVKGRGFAGAVKRHGFHGAPASHGHDHPRAVGSIGQRFPQHVRPGLRMAGRMGGGQATVLHSMVIAVDGKKQLLLVKGGVPGPTKTLVEVVTTGEKKEFGKIHQYESKTAATEAALSADIPVNTDETAKNFIGDNKETSA